MRLTQFKGSGPGLISRDILLVRLKPHGMFLPFFPLHSHTAKGDSQLHKESERYPQTFVKRNIFCVCVTIHIPFSLTSLQLKLLSCVSQYTDNIGIMMRYTSGIYDGSVVNKVLFPMLAIVLTLYYMKTQGSIIFPQCA